MKSKTIDFASSGLPYIFVTVPVKSSSVGEIIGVPLERIEKAVAVEIIRKGIPLGGAEVSFLRKVLGLSLQKLALKLGVSAPAVLKWEREKGRLHPMNEVALRALVAEHLGISLEGHFSVLVGREHTPTSLRLKVA